MSPQRQISPCSLNSTIAYPLFLLLGRAAAVEEFDEVGGEFLAIGQNLRQLTDEIPHIARKLDLALIVQGSCHALPSGENSPARFEELGARRVAERSRPLDLRRDAFDLLSEEV